MSIGLLSAPFTGEAVGGNAASKDGGGGLVSLFWRVFTLNAVVFAAATAILVFTPVTVSFPTTVTEGLILSAGLSVMLVANALLLRWALGPLDRLRSLMERVDLLRPGQRLPAPRGREFAALVLSFNDMLDRLEAERRESAGRALQAQEAERRRVARDLHDEVGQSLTAVLLQLKRVLSHTSEESDADVREAQETVRASLDEVRRIVRELRPGVLEDLGLISALNAFSTGFAERTGLQVERRFQADLPPLSGDAELALYRIAQESLTNAARHAHASHIELALERTDTGVLIGITDDGQGTRDTAREGGGIRGMRERALHVNGDLTIGPGPGGGTRVRFVVPADRSEQPPQRGERSNSRFHSHEDAGPARR
jgi:two-component system, NarL family, sensor histidine kinase UhpB